MALTETVEDATISARIQQNLGRIAVKTKNYTLAFEHYKKALELAKAVGYERCQTSVRGDIGLLLLKEKKHHEGQALLEASLQDCVITENNRGILRLAIELAKLYLRQLNLKDLTRVVRVFWLAACRELENREFGLEQLLKRISTYGAIITGRKS